jgi:predicted dehydrogenase
LKRVTLTPAEVARKGAISVPEPIEAVLVGAGQRGYEAYGPYALAHPEGLRFVAVAEPDERRRARFAQAHHIPAERQFRSWTDLVARDRFAEAALVCTLDPLHTAPAVALLEAGYHTLLEKPMATTAPDCVRLVQASEGTGSLLMICHVLRYTDFFARLHEILGSGRLGEIITVEQRENVVYWHMAHSFVRGNWRRADEGNPMILAKCCHDLDILFWNLGPVERLSSFGSLSHYRSENAPSRAPERCTDGCPHQETCAWYAPRLYAELIPLMHMARRSHDTAERLGATLYLDHRPAVNLARKLIPRLEHAFDYQGWPVSVISEDARPEARLNALCTGQYGRCVYRCDNDVVDHQVVSMEFASGVTGVLHMHGHSYEDSRTMRYDGSQATLRGMFSHTGWRLEIHDHHSGKAETLSSVKRLQGHGGGDEGLMAAFVDTVRRGQAEPLTSARASLESHLLAFAAEQSRLARGAVVEMADYRGAAEKLSSP